MSQDDKYAPVSEEDAVVKARLEAELEVAMFAGVSVEVVRGTALRLGKREAGRGIRELLEGSVTRLLLLQEDNRGGPCRSCGEFAQPRRPVVN